ncbi:MAG: SLBB domain-containing protein [Candidatus Zixiibacteriota bacterium]|nr:MAG: SLBB domain-containing protein [candidate division Zixibacteria bacterium]
MPVGLLLVMAGAFVYGQEVPLPELPAVPPPFSRPIDPNTYLIRPGDVLQVTFLQSQIPPDTLVVDPEGRVVDNTVGVIDLSDRTLAQARGILVETLRQLYNVPDIVVGITEPRLITISVQGKVVAPGTYNAYTSQRVSEVIELAGGILPDGSRRWISLTGGPEPLAVDLDRAAYLAELVRDPYVYAGQTILVPNKARARVQVAGEVTGPREVELVPGDDLDLLLSLAGGLRIRADTTALRVIRKSGEAFDGEIKGGDIILVPARRLSVEEMPVSVFGAVRSPGLYDYDGGMTVGELIRMAGGHLPEANVDNITVFRKPIVDEKGRITDIRYPISDLAGNGDEFKSIKLQPDDSVFVPVTIGFVSVTGAVYNPGLLPYIKGRDVMFYVNSAGGFLPVANRAEVAVFNPISRITAMSATGVVVGDGSVLTVDIREELK